MLCYPYVIVMKKKLWHITIDTISRHNNFIGKMYNRYSPSTKELEVICTDIFLIARQVHWYINMVECEHDRPLLCVKVRASQ